MVPPHCHQWMNHFMSQFQNQHPGCGANKEEAPSGGDEQNKTDTDKKGETTPEEAYLKNIGQSVAAFLTPFGMEFISWLENYTLVSSSSFVSFG